MVRYEIASMKKKASYRIRVSVFRFYAFPLSAVSNSIYGMQKMEK